jgi:hypothetical protein
MKKLLLASIIIFSVSSCELFTARDSEEPNSLSSSQVPATTPDILFINFKTSIESKIVENYLACFVDQTSLQKKYSFIASSGSMAQFATLSNWGIEAERQYFNNVKTISLAGNSILLKLSNQVNTPLGDSAIYQFDYIFSIQTKDQTIAGDYKGTAQFKIYLDSRNQWVIVSWEDLRKDDGRTWSDLKGRMY